MLTITLPSGGPAYRQVADAIRREIIRGNLAPGQKLPPVRQAAIQWNVSAGTVQRAFEQLVIERYVVTRLGHQGGTFVADVVPRNSGDDYATARAVGKIYGGTRKSEIVSAEVIPATEEVARMLGLNEGDPVVRRERVTYPNVPDPVKPVSVSISYHDAELMERAPLLTSKERVPQGTPRYIEENTGYVGVDIVESIVPQLVSDYMAEKLKIPAGSPVLVTRSTLSAQDGYVVEYGVCVTPPDQERVYRYSIKE